MIDKYLVYCRNHSLGFNILRGKKVFFCKLTNHLYLFSLKFWVKLAIYIMEIDVFTLFFHQLFLRSIE